MDTARLILLTAGLVLCTGVSGCQRREDADNPLRSDWGVVLPVQEQIKLPEYCAPSRASDLSGQWTPGRTEIDRLERRLPPVLGDALSRVILEKDEKLPRPGDYYRQYGGFYRDGRRIVYVCGLHRGLVEMTAKTMEPQAWMHRALGANDAGLAVFRVLYDVDADKFGSVQFEGRFSGSVRSR
jgi:hypothetical protein